MDIFYIIVLSVAIMLLILVLTYIGIKMMYSRNSSTNTFPPTASACPDYWDSDSNGRCVVPGSNATNHGSIDPSKLNSNTCGYVSPNSFDFNASCWTKSGSSICSKNLWAKQNNITWDGITNYNGCT
jgi:hypothetical protein